VICEQAPFRGYSRFQSWGTAGEQSSSPDVPFPNALRGNGIHDYGDKLPEDKTDTLSRAAVGKTPAELDAALPAAAAEARRQRLPMSSDLLRWHVGINQPNPELHRRIAIHEASRALAAELLVPESVVKLSLSDRDSRTERRSTFVELTVPEIENTLLI